MVTLADEQRLMFLKASIASYISQTYENKEMVIAIDNPGAQDDNQVLSYLSSLNRPDIHCVIPNRKLCLGALRNLSMANANGEILCQWDDDDLSHPERVAAQAQFLISKKYDASILTDNLHIFHHAEICYWESGKRNLIGGRPCTLMFRNGHGLGYPESGPLSVRGEDTHFLKQLQSRFRVGYFEAPAFHYLYFFHGHNTMDLQHHRRLALKTSVPNDLIVENRDSLIKGVKQVMGFNFGNLRMMGKDGALFTWSRSNDSIVFEDNKPAYRCRKMALLPSGKPGVSLVHSPGRSMVTLVATSTARALKRMSDFKPLDEHVWDSLARKKIPPSDVSGLRDSLSQLANDGFMISDRELKAKVASHDETEADKKMSITTFAVPTCGRSEVLLRCVTSFLENFREHNRKLRVIIADDSVLASQQMANVACLKKLSTTYREFTFSYAGVAEKRQYAEVLARHSGIDPNIVEFGLFNPENLANKACGPNRNALFLETVGECFLSADDDVICRPSASRGIRHTVRVTTAQDPTRVLLFPDQQTLLNEQPAATADLVGFHEGVLGRSLGSIFRSEPKTSVTFDRLNDEFLTLLERRAVRTRVSWNGIYGDPGSTYPTYYLWKDKLTYRQLTASEDAYRKLSVSRQIFRSPTSLTFGAGGYCQSTVLAYDHRTALPPFMPLRGLDIVFGKMLVRFCPSVIAYLPWALMHFPPIEKNTTAKDLKLAGNSIPYYAILVSLLATHSASEFDCDEAASLIKLGTHLSDIGRLPAADFEELIRTQLWISVSRRIEALSQQIRKFQRAPNYWVDGLSAHIQVLNKRLTPAGFRHALMGDGADFPLRIALAQRLTERFGRLLQAWPALIQAAVELKSLGIGICSRVPA